jgi:Flp pilus assembly pilin Flp
VLLGIITATVIATVVLVADWVDGTWTNLESTLQAEAPT